MEVLKVSAISEPKAVAGAITWAMQKQNHLEIQAMGAVAVNQAVKSIAIARSYLSLNGKNLVCIPAFLNTEIDGKPCTMIKFIVRVGNLN